jgi:hypothetical protein
VARTKLVDLLTVFVGHPRPFFNLPMAYREPGVTDQERTMSVPLVLAFWMQTAAFQPPITTVCIQNAMSNPGGGDLLCLAGQVGGIRSWPGLQVLGQGSQHGAGDAGT